MPVEDLEAYGLEQMERDEIRGFLSSQGMGVLGLPTERSPYLLPLAYDYDGEDRLYFTYIAADGSRKVELSEQADSATFLVFSADSMFNWESVLLEGTLEEWSREDERPAVNRAWRPDLFQRADLPGEVAVYTFEITAQSGIRHAGLPSGFERAEDEPLSHD